MTRRTWKVVLVRTGDVREGDMIRLGGHWYPVTGVYPSVSGEHVTIAYCSTCDGTDYRPNPNVGQGSLSVRFGNRDLVEVQEPEA